MRSKIQKYVSGAKICKGFKQKLRQLATEKQVNDLYSSCLYYHFSNHDVNNNSKILSSSASKIFAIFSPLKYALKLNMLKLIKLIVKIWESTVTLYIKVKISYQCEFKTAK